MSCKKFYLATLKTLMRIKPSDSSRLSANVGPVELLMNDPVAAQDKP